MHGLRTSLPVPSICLFCIDAQSHAVQHCGSSVTHYDGAWCSSKGTLAKHASMRLHARTVQAMHVAQYLSPPRLHTRISRL
eukprot:6208815-Pleurochrysis_carterae.AAC.1